MDYDANVAASTFPSPPSFSASLPAWSHVIAARVTRLSHGPSLFGENKRRKCQKGNEGKVILIFFYLPSSIIISVFFVISFVSSQELAAYGDQNKYTTKLRCQVTLNAALDVKIKKLNTDNMLASVKSFKVVKTED